VSHILEVENLHTYFHTYAGVSKAVDGISFSLGKNETLGVVGESGCGKSVMARSILRLIQNPPGKIVKGKILFQGRDLLTLPESAIQKIRGRDISMIFQEPMTALNPVFTVGSQLTEALRLHQGLSKRDARDRSEELLQTVHIPSPAMRLKEYPFQMSGGMRQRIVIAMALACSPQVLLADEPTTALDVTIQAQILELITELQRKFHTAMVLITHDLGVIAETAHRVIVMYTGQVVEQADVNDLFNHPRHPYTQGLMGSVPKIGRAQNRHTGQLEEIKGMVPDLCDLPDGCTFHHRCVKAVDRCRKERPALVKVSENHWGRCFLL